MVLLPPRNVFVTHPYIKGALDIRWDNPLTYPENSQFNDIVGVHIYRSLDSTFGPFTKITDTPISIGYYRDQTIEHTVTITTDASSWLSFGDNPRSEFVIQVPEKHIVKVGKNGLYANHFSEVSLTVNSKIVPPLRVLGATGEVYLIKSSYFDHSTGLLVSPEIPYTRDSVQLTYTYVTNQILLNLNKRVFYKVVAVRQNGEESDLSLSEPATHLQGESLDWVWRQGKRLNGWILEQAGDRVKLLIRKWAGVKCDCWNEKYKRAKGDCTICFGTSWVGGYEGPFDIKIQPPEAEKDIQETEYGLRISYVYGTFAMYPPLISKWDVIVKKTGERYLVGPVNYQGQRDVIFQQHFDIGHLNSKHVIYKFPIYGGELATPASYNADREAPLTDASPAIPNKPEIPDNREIQGRTPTFENITY